MRKIKNKVPITRPGTAQVSRKRRVKNLDQIFPDMHTHPALRKPTRRA